MKNRFNFLLIFVAFVLFVSPVIADESKCQKSPLDTILSHSPQFRVKKISLSGMLIQSEQALVINSFIPMGLSLNADDPCNFSGRIVTCQMGQDNGRAQYEIGVEFSNLTDKCSTLLKIFINNLAVTKGNPEA